MADSPCILLVVAPYYRDIADRLVAGARGHLESEGVKTELLEVPGALEIPPAIRRVHDMKPDRFGGYVALGCVIRGETSHYEIVAGESARGLMELGIGGGIPAGHWTRMVASVLDAGRPGYDPDGKQSIRKWFAKAQRGIQIGNGILTVDTRDQAWARTAEGRNKGEEAARACLSLVRLRVRP